MKMQTSWPASDIWMDFAREYTTRVEEMSGEDVCQFDLLPAGAGCWRHSRSWTRFNDGVIDMAHTVPVYWYGKSKAAVLLPAQVRVWGGNANTMLGWFYQGGGQELYRRN